MIITAYRSEKYRKTETYKTEQIYGTLEPEDMTDEDREAFKEGRAQSMCCFTDGDGMMHCVPWEFVISISDG